MITINDSSTWSQSLVHLVHQFQVLIHSINSLQPNQMTPGQLDFRLNNSQYQPLRKPPLEGKPPNSRGKTLITRGNPRKRGNPINPVMHDSNLNE